MGCLKTLDETFEVDHCWIENYYSRGQTTTVSTKPMKTYDLDFG